MSTTKRALSTAGAVVAGLTIIGGAAVAHAATNTPAPTPPAATGSATPGNGTASAGTGDQSGQGRQERRGPAHQHTAVTGDEATKVGDAVKAKDAAVTVTKVEKDPDGSYDVMATKNGQNTCFEVSADLATITQSQVGRASRSGRVRVSMGAVTVENGDEATKVTAAVTAKDAALSVQRVMKDADGSYDVMASKDGARVHVEVSADLATITQSQARMGGPGGPGGRGGHARGQQGQTQPGQTQPGQTQPAQPSSGATTQG